MPVDSNRLWPESPDWDRRPDVAGRAMRLIADGFVDREGVGALARRLGASPGQLRRELLAAVGAAPGALARRQRAHTARLLHEGTARERGEVVLRLRYRAPLDSGRLIRFLALRCVPGVEEVIDGAYRRSLRLPMGAGIVELEPRQADVRARYLLDDPRDLAPAVQRSRALLDLDSDPRAVLDALGADQLLGPLVRAAPGLRLVGHVDAHELAVRAVLGQQVSLAGAATLAARLVTQQGEPLSRPLGTVTHLFPTAQALVAIEPERLAMPGARRAALLALTRALASGELVLDPGADRAQASRGLLALPGIGPWTADYVAMRGLRDPDAFLPTDLGVRHALTALGADGRPAAAARLAESWRPYRAYGLMHLWAHLAETKR
jgi:AraC family transcriptional regulator of adaptative response / DNA-3-methyladenine glycosylase II